MSDDLGRPMTDSEEQVAHEIAVGPLTLCGPIAVERVEHGQSARKWSGAGSRRLHEVRGPEGAITLADNSWENGDRDLAIVSRGDAPETFDPLVRRLRTSIELKGDGRSVMRLRIPAIGEPGARPTAHRASLDELNAAAGLDAEELLCVAGALKVGPARVVYGETRARMCEELYVSFADSGRCSNAPVLAYLVTPVLTFWRMTMNGQLR